MKNFFKKFAKSIALTFAFVLASVTLIACSGSTSSNKKAPTVSNVNSSLNEPTEKPSASEVTNSDELKISGIYTFDKDYSFDDIHYSDIKEILTYFQTRDLNGVYRNVKEKGFDEFVKNLTKYNDGENELNRALSIDNKTVTNLAYNENLVYSYVNEENNFTFTQKENKLETAENLPNLEYDEETNTFTVYYQFSYTENGKTIYTPLFVKTTLSYVNHTADLSSAKDFTYSANSSKIVTTSNTTDMTTYLNQLAKMFGIESDNIAVDVTTELSTWKISVDEKFEEIVVTYKDNSFSIVANNGDYFSINNSIDATINFTTIDLTTNSHILTFTVQIDDETTFTFEFVA